MKPNFVSENPQVRKALEKLEKAKQSEKEVIYASEELTRWRNLRYDVYLECGNMKDICEMKPWDLIGIAKRSHDRAPKKHGEYRITKRTKYQEDVIKRGREERAKALKGINKNVKETKSWKNTTDFR